MTAPAGVAAATGATARADRSPVSWLPRGELIHLVYLANLLWQPFFNPQRSWVDWMVVCGVVVVFVPLYVASLHPDAQVKRRAVIAMVVLGSVATLANVGASVLFVYAVSGAAWLDRERVVQWQLALTILCGVLVFASPIAWPYRLYGILPSVVFVWLIGWMVSGDVAQHDAAERLRIDNVRIEQLATADERERIARDLHDLVGQGLTALVVKAQLVQSLVASDPAAAGAQASELEAAARDALAQVRIAITGLGQVALDDEVDTARRTLAAAGVDLDIDIDTTATGPGPMVERTLALALREATTNVVRHAEAGSCRVTLARVDDRWRLEVVDDGVGGLADEGNGLRGMRERIVAVGGTVRRRGDDGTQVTIWLPA